MSKMVIGKFLAGVGISVTLMMVSCEKDTNLAAPPLKDQSFSEEFDTTSAAISRGWQIINASSPKGSNVWQQGGSVPPWFRAYSNHGNNAGYIGADYNGTTYTATQFGQISNWLISPITTMKNGDKIVFYTRSHIDFFLVDSTNFGDRLQVRINRWNSESNVGQGDDPGDFNTLLLDINPQQIFSSNVTPDLRSYPTQWTRYEATIIGLDTGPVTGRFAFRYYVDNSSLDPTSATFTYGDGVAIDLVSYKSAGY